MPDERFAKPLDSDDFQCSIPEPVIAAAEADNSRFSAVEQRCFYRDFDGLKPGIAQRRFAHSELPALESDLA
jgi:hypothetical protein